MFTRSAAYYDVTYQWKNYREEVRRLHAFIQQHKRSRGRRLLDVACGTGNHLLHLREHYTVEGLDREPQLLETARHKLDGVTFHEADMQDFDLKTRFDIVTCLFSSIGYVRTRPALAQALACMARHLVPGGLLVVEPWFPPEGFFPGRPHLLCVDQEELKIARMNVSAVVSEASNDVSILDFQYLVATPGGVAHFSERHELGLFTVDMMRQAFAECGLDVLYEAPGLTDRGVYLAPAPMT